MHIPSENLTKNRKTSQNICTKLTGMCNVSTGRSFDLFDDKSSTRNPMRVLKPFHILLCIQLLEFDQPVSGNQHIDR